MNNEDVIRQPLAVIIPARDEQMTLRNVINDIRRYVPNAEIIVVDDGSNDQTPHIAKQECVVVLTHVESQGAWRAMQTGMLYGYNRNFQYAVTMDADGQHLASEISVLVNELEKSNLDLVIGSDPSRASNLRSFAWDIFRLITGVKFQDLTSGFRLYSRLSLAKLINEDLSLFEYQDMGVLLTLRANHLAIRETLVKMNPRQFGHSKIFSSWLKVFYYMTTTLMLSISKRKKLPINRNL